jgi:hypothetical protein
MLETSFPIQFSKGSAQQHISTVFTLETLFQLSFLSSYSSSAIRIFVMSNDINPHTGRPFSGSYYVHRERAQALPVVQQMDRLLAAIDSHQVTIVMGETGTGKSTQIPQYALERFSTFLDGKCIGLTQPRRLAAEEASDHSTIQSGFRD